MQIQLLSDLHLEIERPYAGPGKEFYYYEFPAVAECLALLGDIGCTMDDRLFTWLRVQLQKFKTVLYVAGNHGMWTIGSEFRISSLTNGFRIRTLWIKCCKLPSPPCIRVSPF